MNRLLRVLFCVPLCFVSACQARDSEPVNKSSVSPAPADSRTAAKESPSTILARVNGIEIPARDLEHTLTLYLEKNGQNRNSVPDAQIEVLRKQLLDSLVSSEVLYQASVAAKISVPEEKVSQEIRSLEAKFPSEQEFTRYLRDQGLTVEDMKVRVRRNLATEQLVKQEVDPGVSVSEAEIADYYEKNKERMRRSESVRLSEIFVRVDSRASADVKAKARQKIEALLKELRKGKEFAALARQFSESPDAKDGGDMGYVSRNGTLPVLTEAAFRLKVGEVSDVVESNFGYHLLKVTEKKPAGDLTLAEAKTQISNFLQQQKELEAFNTYLGKLKAAAKIEILAPTP